MSEKLFNDFNETVGQVGKLAEINTAAATRLFEQQSACLNGLVNANFDYARSLIDCADFGAVADANKVWGGNVATTIKDASAANMATLTEAGEAARPLVEGWMKNAQSRVAATVEAAQSKFEETVKPAAKKKAA